LCLLFIVCCCCCILNNSTKKAQFVKMMKLNVILSTFNALSSFTILILIARDKRFGLWLCIDYMFNLFSIFWMMGDNRHVISSLFSVCVMHWSFHSLQSLFFLHDFLLFLFSALQNVMMKVMMSYSLWPKVTQIPLDLKITSRQSVN